MLAGASEQVVCGQMMVGEGDGRSEGQAADQGHWVLGMVWPRIVGLGQYRWVDLGW